MRTHTLLGRLLILCCAALVMLGAVSRNETRIFLIGDSTMADKPIISNPEVGWGQMFPIFFKPGVVCGHQDLWVSHQSIEKITRITRHPASVCTIHLPAQA